MKKKAFTLIELLVVISIIALLLSILMPSLAKVKEQAKSLVCRTNLRQLSLALATYSMDYNNKALISQAGRDIWPMMIAPYMGDGNYADDPQAALDGVMKIVLCPSTIRPPLTPGGVWGKEKLAWQNGTVDFEATGSYGLNGWYGGVDIEVVLANWGGGGWFVEGDQGRSFRDGTTANSSVPVFGDCKWFEPVPRVTDLVSEGSPAFASTREFRLLERHGGDISMSFADGHAEKIDVDDLWKFKWHKGYNAKASDAYWNVPGYVPPVE